MHSFYEAVRSDVVTRGVDQFRSLKCGKLMPESTYELTTPIGSNNAGGSKGGQPNKALICPHKIWH